MKSFVSKLASGVLNGMQGGGGSSGNKQQQSSQQGASEQQQGQQRRSKGQSSDKSTTTSAEQNELINNTTLMIAACTARPNLEAAATSSFTPVLPGLAQLPQQGMIDSSGSLHSAREQYGGTAASTSGASSSAVSLSGGRATSTADGGSAPQTPRQQYAASSSDGSREADEKASELLLKALELEAESSELEFRRLKSIEAEYSVGDEVMPVGSRGPEVKAVLFGTRKSDGKKVIMKRRHRERSFKDRQELAEWLSTTKYLYQISGGASQQAPHAKGQLQLIANMVDIVEDDTHYFAVMEHVRGRDLFDFFIEEKIYSKDYKIPLAKQLCKQLLGSLAEMDAHMLVHKDLKLENLVFDETLTRQNGAVLLCPAKVIDFDTVEIYKPGHKAFHVLGTDQYIAPESYAGLACPVSDMWALGVVMYTVLCGSFPFHYALFDDQPGENYVGHIRMDQIRRRLRIARVDWSSQVWNDDADARDFVRKCFTFDVKRRLTVHDALNHPFVRGVELKVKQ